MKKYILITICAILIIFLGIIIWESFIAGARRADNFSVRQGASTREIAQDLNDQNLIVSPLLFTIWVYKNHYLLQPGVYKITKGEKMLSIISKMERGEIEARLVTIPEGWRLTQIDAELAEKKVIKAGELKNIAASDEGYLFPDTYHFALDATAEEVRDEMKKNYQHKTSDLGISREQLIIASIVEREAKFDEDRAQIAGVYFSRLDLGMKLEADPTVQYAKGSWAAITVADYTNVISPYNTYLNAGLPPSPICNPGLKSIEAAKNPIKNGNRYFFTDKAGHAVFSKTLDEQKAKLKE